MSRKFGKKNSISTDLSRAVIGLLGESGIGKTTTMYEIAKELYGDDGYIVLDMGSEFGSEYIEDIVSEPVETYKKYKSIVDDIVANKNTDYKDLKVVIIDTLDALFEIGEPYLVSVYNSENNTKKDFVPVKTINQVEGGFMRGQDRLISLVVESIVKLRSAGVGVWYTGHVKKKSSDDAFSGSSYDMITTNMSQRYFNAIKNKTHVLGIAYIDREFETKETGKENIVTHAKEMTTKIVSEARKVKFRDDSYTADSKSRLKDIIDEVNLDKDEIINAITDAINKAKAEVEKSNKSSVVEKRPAEKPVETQEYEDEEIIPDEEENVENEVTEAQIKEALINEIRDLIKTSEKEKVDEVKAGLKESGKKMSDLDVDELNEIKEKLM